MVEVKRFSVGEVAARVGVNTSALRFYEEHGLIRYLLGDTPSQTTTGVDAKRRPPR